MSTATSPLSSNTFIYEANTQNFSFTNYNSGLNGGNGGYEAQVEFSLDYVNYDTAYKELQDETATILEQTVAKEREISTILANTATHHGLTENVLADITNTIGLLMVNIENIKNSVIQIQEDIEALEERGKRRDLGIVTRSAYWYSDCNRNDRFNRLMMISTIENLKECGLYDALVEEINNPTEV